MHERQPAVFEEIEGLFMAALASLAADMGMRDRALAYIDRTYAAFDVACSGQDPGADNGQSLGHPDDPCGDNAAGRLPGVGST